MAKKKKYPQAPSGGIIVVFIVIALLLVIALEYLDHRQGNDTFIFSRILKPAEEKKASPAVTEERDPVLFSHRLINVFLSRNMKIHYFRDRGGVYHVRVTLTREDQEGIVGDLQKLLTGSGRRLALKEVRKEESADITLYQIMDQGEVTHHLLFTVQPVAVMKQSPLERGGNIRGRVAIIIDDVGYADGVSLQLKNTGIPLTASVIPSARYAASEASRLEKLGLESMIHLPMQSSHRNQNNGAAWDFLTLHSSREEIRKILRRARSVVPHARGANNHMGSLITSEPYVIGKILEAVKEAGLFFVDSRTSVDSVAYQTARSMNMVTGYRDVFLDHVQDYRYTRNQIRKLVDIALKKKQAIAIGHPFDSTIRAIRDSRAYFRDQRVEVVPISRILH